MDTKVLTVDVIHSKNAVFNNVKAIRGGIPIVFRKFNEAQ